MPESVNGDHWRQIFQFNKKFYGYIYDGYYQFGFEVEFRRAHRSHRSTMVGKMMGCMYDDTSSDKMEW